VRWGRISDDLRDLPGDRLRVYSDEHGFFEPLLTFLISSSAIGITTTMLSPGMPFKMAVPEQRLTMSGMAHVANCAFLIWSLPILQGVTSGVWPKRLEIVERPGSFVNSKDAKRTGFPSAWSTRLFEPMFLQYFESQKPERPRSRLWEFGTVIRNACAHNGLIDIRKSNAAAVSWRTLSYSPTDNGKRIWFADMTAVELILLMEDLDAELRIEPR
jgi:hypothetical protein